MTYELQGQALCDHRVHREFTFIDSRLDPDHRSLRLFQPISNDNVRLWYNGEEIPQNAPGFSWSLVLDEFSAKESPRKKIYFARPIRDIAGYFEVSYTVSPDLCRKCYGLGILYDHQFDKAGRLILLVFEQKLIQQVTKMLMTLLGSNPFVPGYGTSIPEIIYTAISDPGGLQQQLVTEVSLALEKQRNIHYYQTEVQYLDPREILDQLLNVDVLRSTTDPRVYYIQVQVSTLAGDVLSVERELFLGELFNNLPIREAGIF